MTYQHYQNPRITQYGRTHEIFKRGNRNSLAVDKKEESIHWTSKNKEIKQQQLWMLTPSPPPVFIAWRD